MRITKQHLRRLIKEELLREQGEMLKIIANPTSPETEVFNKIANYALNDDIQGALADSDVNTQDLDLDIDSMRPWVKRVGGEGQWMDEDAVVPDNWDAEAVYDFMEDLESAWYDQRGKEGTQAHLSSPDVKEREAIGTAFTKKHVLPDEISAITYQPRKKAGVVVSIDIETREDISSIDAQWAKGSGTTVDKIIKTLEKGGAELQKKRPSVKHTPPMYD